MINYKLMEYNHFYINCEGDFAVGLLERDNEYDYCFVASHANPLFNSGIIGIGDREIPNDGTWIEIDINAFKAITAFHITGHVVKFPTDSSGRKLPIISKKY